MNYSWITQRYGSLSLLFFYWSSLFFPLLNLKRSQYIICSRRLGVERGDPKLFRNLLHSRVFLPRSRGILRVACVYTRHFVGSSRGAQEFSMKISRLRNQVLRSRETGSIQCFFCFGVLVRGGSRDGFGPQLPTTQRDLGQYEYTDLWTCIKLFLGSQSKRCSCFQPLNRSVVDGRWGNPKEASSDF